MSISSPLESEPEGTARRRRADQNDLGRMLDRIAAARLHAAQSVWSEIQGGIVGHRVLRELDGCEPTSQKALATALDIDRTAMTYLLKELESSGLVSRQRHRDDRRARLPRLTTVGHERLVELDQAVGSVDDELQATLRPEERVTLLSLLRRLLDSDPET